MSSVNPQGKSVERFKAGRTHIVRRVQHAFGAVAAHVQPNNPSFLFAFAARRNARLVSKCAPHTQTHTHGRAEWFGDRSLPQRDDNDDAKVGGHLWDICMRPRERVCGGGI